MMIIWKNITCYLYYKICERICKWIEDLVYENSIPHALPYQWVPPGMEIHVFRNCMRSWIPNFNLEKNIFHFTTFVRSYRRRYTRVGAFFVDSIWIITTPLQPVSSYTIIYGEKGKKGKEN